MLLLYHDNMWMLNDELSVKGNEISTIVTVLIYILCSIVGLSA